MNGANKPKMCNSCERDDDKEEDKVIPQPSTSRAGLDEEPTWNTSTRQLYEGNLKSSSSVPVPKLGNHFPVKRERTSSFAESTSSDDSCVYMYKGYDNNRKGSDVNKHVNCSSPEMDYLEMDFDPCQSNGQDSSDGSYNCEAGDLNEEQSNETVEFESNDYEESSTSIYRSSSSPPASQPEMNYVSVTSSSSNPSPLRHHYLLPGMSQVHEYRMTVFEKEDSTFLEQNVILKKHLADTDSDDGSRILNDSCCIANIKRAVYALLDLGITFKEEDALTELELLDFRGLDMSVTDYITIMSNGNLAISKVQGIVNRVFGGSVTTRFFSTTPPRIINLHSWLNYWIRKDAVVLLCLNFHLTDEDCSCDVNSTWHYQLLHSISSKGLHILSQYDTLSDDVLSKMLNNPSEVLITRDEVVSHWTPTCDLKPLIFTSEYSWKQYNVLGQVVNIIRETMTGKSDDEVKFLKVPAQHETGVLIMMESDNKYSKELLEAEEFLKVDNTTK